MVQVARTWTDASHGMLLGHRILICDGDTKWSVVATENSVGGFRSCVHTVDPHVA